MLQVLGVHDGMFAHLSGLTALTSMKVVPAPPLPQDIHCFPHSGTQNPLPPFIPYTVVESCSVPSPMASPQPPPSPAAAMDAMPDALTAGLQSHQQLQLSSQQCPQQQPQQHPQEHPQQQPAQLPSCKETLTQAGLAHCSCLISLKVLDWASSTITTLAGEYGQKV